MSLVVVLVVAIAVFSAGAVVPARGWAAAAAAFGLIMAAALGLLRVFDRTHSRTSRE